jgi:WD40 repeat protein
MSRRRPRALARLLFISCLTSCTSDGTNAQADKVISVGNAVGLERVASFDLPSSFVNALVFTPDSRQLISGDRNREVIIWERESWERSTFQEAEGNLQADDEAGIHFFGTLVLSPDGETLVTTNPEGDVRGRDLQGNDLFSLSYGARVYSTVISPDGRYLAVAGVAGNIMVFDLETRQQAADLPSDREYIAFLVFSPDGGTLVAGYERPANLMSTWNTATWQETSTFAHAEERFNYHDALTTPDGRQLVIGSDLWYVREEEDPSIDFLDLESKEVVRRLSRYGSTMPFQMAYSPGGSLLAAGMNDGTFWIWDADTGDALKVIPNHGSVQSVAFSPDGELLAFGVEGEGIQIWAVGG